VDYGIRSGPASLVMFETLPFHRRTLFNPYDFNQFLQALQSSQKIRVTKLWASRWESHCWESYSASGKDLGELLGE
jgi:hypothetical protein